MPQFAETLSQAFLELIKQMFHAYIYLFQDLVPLQISVSRAHL